ncbi:MAG: type II toxin-antitoxin system VapC family toxin [Chloroflexi bacterium]|nr:type II toxin-antitoxin system VapC family toxin [Chloroflexota bacterium]MCY3937165.1 type II toxin-antitoxin system VapC family toxin [Chloroflexota bacterium]
MSGLVVDASIVVAWLFDDEDEPRADRVLEQLAEDGALVPQLWHLETRNALLTAERRRRLSPEEVRERLDALKGLPIATDGEPDLQSAFDLARAHGLSLYDALYLELAKRKRAELATLDGSLGRAAIAEGMSVSAT